MENRKIILSSYIAAAIISWFLCRAVIQWLQLTFYHIRGLPGIKIGAEAVPAVIALVVFLVLLNHSKVNTVMDEAVSELRKVTWPNRDDVVKSTWVVMFCVLIASFILAGFDLVWGKLIGFLLKG